MIFEDPLTELKELMVLMVSVVVATTLT